jgi:hypothetical protein
MRQPKRALIERELTLALEGSPMHTTCAQLATLVVDRLEELGIVGGYVAEELPVAQLEQVQAPDVAKELVAWLDNNVRRCGHGYIDITCGQCMAGWLPR